MQSNHFFQVIEEEEPLNGAQKLLLASTWENGMTETLLRSWVKHPRGFTASHGEAVYFLVKKLGMLPSIAIREIDGLSQKEVNLFKPYFERGINRKYILANRQYLNFDAPWFGKTLGMLVKKKVPLPQALLELVDLYDSEIALLHDYYRYGLRGADLKEADLDDAYHVYFQFKIRINDVACQDALRYFHKVFRQTNRNYSPLKALREACTELMKIEQDALNVSGKTVSKRIKFLLNSVSQGVRADDYPKEFNAGQKKTYYMLRFWHGERKEDALVKMHGLSDDKIAFMRRYFGRGINHNKLRDFPHHTDYVIAASKRFGWDAVDALDYLAVLTDAQMKYLHYLADYGLKLRDIKILSSEAIYSEMRKDIAILLICEHAMLPVEALSIATSESEEDLVTLLRKAENVGPAL